MANSNLSEDDWQFFAAKLTKQSFNRKSTVLAAGQTESHLSFIEKGIVRFYLGDEEKQTTFGFAFENYFVSAYDSFLLQQPCNYYIETLSDTILWRLTHQDLAQIYEHTSIGNTIGRLASEDLFLKKSKRELSLLMDSPETRYLKLFTEQPHLLKQIPLKYIASYIGITPQALSRIRRRIC
ncbi:Crp/Fnr family transcriptional regulator [Flexibacter flexilis]|nr:Crp/Fnr family transcriptional regulator [Flexibacter flexilis]